MDKNKQYKKTKTGYWLSLILISLFTIHGSLLHAQTTPAMGDTLRGGVVISYNAGTGNVLILHPEQTTSNWTAANAWASGKGSGWRQPTLSELQTIYQNKGTINSGLGKISGTNLLTNEYWSGSVSNANNSWANNFGTGVVRVVYNVADFSVRAVLAFNLFTYLNELEKEGVIADAGAQISNSIVWGNQDKGGVAANLSSNGTVSYSCIEGGATGTGNIATDPQFMSATDYHLQVTSPCLNTGNASLVPAELVADIDGKPRTSNNKVDMGAYQMTQCTAPSITIQPINGVYGAIAKVFVAATGTGTLTYQWYKDGQPVTTQDPDTCLVSGAGKYSVAITGTCGTKNSDTATIAKATPTLTLQPETVTYTGNALNITAITAQGVIGTVTPANFNPTYSYDLSGTITTAALHAGTYSVTASITGDANHNGVTSAAVNYTVEKATPVIGLTAKNTNYTGSSIGIDAPVITGSTTASTLSVTYEYSGTGTTTYGPGATAPVNAGTYNVTVATVGDTNHNAASAITTLSIGVNTPALTLTDKSTVYTGSPVTANAVSILPVEAQHLAISYEYIGTLLDGTNYPETATAPTDAGNYSVTASVAGDANFAAASVTANLHITKKAASISMQNKSTSFTGLPIGIDAPVTEPLTAVLSVTYQGTGATVYAETTMLPTNGGTYLVTAAFAGNNNYTTTSATANLTITDAGSPTLVLNNKTVTYNGAPQAIDAATIQPLAAAYLTVSYSYANAGYGPSATPPTAAGVYTVTATTPADANFTAGSVTALLTINPKSITITADNQTKDFGQPNPAFTFTVDPALITNDQMSGIPTVNGNETVGIHNIQQGTLSAGANYNITYVAGTLTIRSINTSVNGITVDGETTDRTGNNFSILSNCGVSSVSITVNADANATVTINGVAAQPNVAANINLPKYGNNTFTLVVTAQNGDSETYLLTVSRPIPVEEVYYERFAGVLTVPVQVPGIGAVSRVEWYKDDVLLDRDVLKGYLDASSEGIYYALINGEVRTCEISVAALRALLRAAGPTDNPAISLSAYPNPVSSNAPLFIVTSDWENARIQLYSPSGRLLKEEPATGFETILTAPATSGVYMIKVISASGSRDIKVVVK